MLLPTLRQHRHCRAWPHRSQNYKNPLVKAPFGIQECRPSADYAVHRTTKLQSKHRSVYRSVDHPLTMLFTEQQNSTVKASVGLHERRPSADYAVHRTKKLQSKHRSVYRSVDHSLTMLFTESQTIRWPPSTGRTAGHLIAAWRLQNCRLADCCLHSCDSRTVVYIVVTHSPWFTQLWFIDCCLHSCDSLTIVYKLWLTDCYLHSCDSLTVVYLSVTHWLLFT